MEAELAAGNDLCWFDHQNQQNPLKRAKLSDVPTAILTQQISFYSESNTQILASKTRIHESINNPSQIIDEKIEVGEDDISGKEDGNFWCSLKKACSETKAERSLSLRQSEEASTRDQSKENTESLLV